MVYFVGAGSGAVDLITLRGDRLLREADVIIYAGSLVNPAILECAKADCEIHNSALMTLEEIISAMAKAESEGKRIVRLHTGDTCLYGALHEQTDALNKLGIGWQVVPGVSSFCGAAAALGAEYTLPGISQSVIITRMEGRTPVPEAERIAAMASHGCSMVIFLSTGLLEQLETELLKGAYTPQTKAAIIFKATWPEEKVFHCTVATLAKTAKENNITKTALILVGEFLGENFNRSMLYHPSFSTEYRQAQGESNGQ